MRKIINYKNNNCIDYKHVENFHIRDKIVAYRLELKGKEPEIYILQQTNPDIKDVGEPPLYNFRKLTSTQLFSNPTRDWDLQLLLETTMSKISPREIFIFDNIQEFKDWL